MVRTQPLSPVPYSGTVAIESGEIAQDLAQYMAASEQTNSALALGVQIGPDGKVVAAGGYLIQVRPQHRLRAFWLAEHHHHYHFSQRVITRHEHDSGMVSPVLPHDGGLPHGKVGCR